MLQKFKSPFSLRKSPLSFGRRLIIGMLLLNLLVIGLAIFVVKEDRLEHMGRARINARNLANLLEHDVSAVFDRSDLVLLTVADEIERQLLAGPIQRQRLEAFLKQQQTHLPEIISLRITDENGLVRFGEGVPTGTRVDLSDREHFILQKGNPKAGLVIAKPVKARISKEWSIPLSRRLNYRNGDFAGIVYINIPVSYFVRKFASLDLGSNGLIACVQQSIFQWRVTLKRKKAGARLGSLRFPTSCAVCSRIIRTA